MHRTCTGLWIHTETVGELCQTGPVTESDFVRPPMAPYPPMAIPPKPKIFLPTTLKDHMRFFQVSARRWWWSLIGLVVLAAAIFAQMLVVTVVVAIMDPELMVSNEVTPTIFIVNNISVATGIAIAVAVSWLFFRQGFGWLVSVVGRFRWKWMVLTLGISAPVYAVMLAVEVAVFGPERYGLNDLHILGTSWVMVIGILVTTPLQCAGEEFTNRAVLPRLVAGLVPFRWVGLALAAVVSSGVFMLMHGAGDIWLNIFYFSVGLTLWWLAYRTGGIEAGIALHVVNNLSSEWMLPFSDISDIFDRSQGTGSPMLLVYAAAQLVLALIVDALARRRGLVRMSSPAAAVPEVVRPRRLCTALAGAGLAGAARPATVEDLPRLADTIRDVPVQWPPASMTALWHVPDPQPPMSQYPPPPLPAPMSQYPPPPMPPAGYGLPAAVSELTTDPSTSGLSEGK